jgi:hypothetical protein
VYALMRQPEESSRIARAHLTRIVDEPFQRLSDAAPSLVDVRPWVWQPRTPRTEATHQPDSSRA